jgi:hypothetical protein
MLHHHTDPDTRSSCHWATGLGSAAAGDGIDPVLAQISNARGDQVRIPMTPQSAETFVSGLRCLAGATPGTSLRTPVFHPSTPPHRDGDGFGIYALEDGRVRVDFHWRGAFTALLITPTQALEFAADLEGRIAASRSRADAA